MTKLAHKERAIAMRRKGKTYTEILSEVPVAKSTLSLWLRSVGLAEQQKQRITRKRIKAALRGARSRKAKRLASLETFANQGKKDIGKLSERELWLLGVALYWAEGSKQNLRSPSVGVQFCNSDSGMHLFFLHWLRGLGIHEDGIHYELYVHVNRKEEINKFRKWWARELSVPVAKISSVYLKKGNSKTNRVSNVGDLYRGLLRIKVRSSTNLNRQITGWVHGIVASLGGGVIGNTSAFGAEDSRIVP